MMANLRRKRRPAVAGFTLIELMVAMLIFVGGALAMVGLLAYGIRIQAVARDATRATAAAKAKVEQLRSFPVTHAQRSVGGSLLANVADHNDAIPGTPLVRRWVVAAGAAGTQNITITVISTNPRIQVPPTVVQVLLR